MTGNDSLYFIALVPREPLLAELWEMKREISSKYNSHHALKSPPHVTLFMPFKWNSSNEEKLIDHFSKIDTQPVKLNLNGYNCFAPRVIYVDVILNDELRSLYEAVKKSAKKILPFKDATYKDRGFTPHLTIAFRDLRKAMFKEAWEEYKSKEYRASQEIDHFTLLKHNGKNWECHHEFPLKN